MGCDDKLIREKDVWDFEPENIEPPKRVKSVSYCHHSCETFRRRKLDAIIRDSPEALIKYVVDLLITPLCMAGDFE